MGQKKGSGHHDLTWHVSYPVYDCLSPSLVGVPQLPSLKVD